MAVVVSESSTTGKRKESAIKQPVDALRRSSTSQDRSDKNQTATNSETNTATGIKTTPPADTTGKAGAMNSNSDKKTDNKASTGISASSAGSNANTTPTTNAGNNSTTKSSAGKQPPTSTVPNSDNKSNEPHKANASNKANKANGVWTGLILGLVLVAVALGIGLWWQQQRFESVAKEVATRLQQSDQQASQASERASQALTLATAQREVVDQLRRELSVANNDLAALQQAWESANEGLDQTLLLNDLKRLITMANQELVLFGNVNSAVSILSSVDTMLQTQSAPALKNLQQAVIQDLARLRAMPQVDVASLSARLDSLIQLTNKAPLLAPAGANNLQGSRDQVASGSTTGGAAAGTSQSPSPINQPINRWRYKQHSLVVILGYGHRSCQSVEFRSQ
jgi:uroporphyrin-3 C-methyltransferase